MSVWGSMGYLIDAFADMVGGLLVGLACAVFLNRYPPWKRVRTKPHDELESGRKTVSFQTEEEERYVHVSRRSVNIKMFLVIAQIVARSGFWDHFLHSYVELLETPNPDIPRVSGVHEEVVCFTPQHPLAYYIVCQGKIYDSNVLIRS